MAIENAAKDNASRGVEAFPPPPRGNVHALAESFEISLEARNLSKRTIRTYLEGVRLLAEFLEARGMPKGHR